jgi:hypothetical protein
MSIDRTGLHAFDMSERHRQWFYECLMLDLDFLAIEYGFNPKKVAAVIEYKHVGKDLDRAQTAALNLLAINYSVFVVYYTYEMDRYTIKPFSSNSKQILRDYQKFITNFFKDKDKTKFLKHGEMITVNEICYALFILFIRTMSKSKIIEILKNKKEWNLRYRKVLDEPKVYDDTVPRVDKMTTNATQLMEIFHRSVILEDDVDLSNVII